MSHFGFGRPRDGLIQLAYTVPDLAAAMVWWTDVMKVGPWYLAENFSGDDPIYRGAPCHALINAALGFVGSLQIELIELANDEPGIQRDVIREHGFGFHHIGQACTDIEAERERYEALGYATVFQATMPSRDLVYFMQDTGRGADGLIELIAAGPAIDAVFTRMWASSIDWTGDRPVRPFAALFE